MRGDQSKGKDYEQRRSPRPVHFFVDHQQQ